MPENGFMTAAETHAEWVAAEAALRARRDPAQLAGEPTPEEAAQLAAVDARLALTRTAFGEAVRAVVQAQDGIEGWRPVTTKEAERIADLERTQARASRDEEDALLARNRLSVAIGAAGAARRAAVS